MHTDDANPRSPLRTVQVLHALATSGEGLALGTLAAHLQLPKTSLFRLLRSLEEGGYVVSQDGLHQLGPEALKLGAALVQASVFPRCALPAMQALASRCGETVILATPDDTGTQIVYSEVIEPSNPLRFSIRPGLARPLHSSASGQAILAWSPPARRAAYLKQAPYPRLASGTITSAAALRRQLAETGARGHAVSVDGMFEGVHSMAAPLFDAGGAVQAAISISSPSSRGLQQEASFAPLLRKAGEEISRLLGYAGTYPPSPGD